MLYQYSTSRTISTRLARLLWNSARLERAAHARLLCIHLKTVCTFWYSRRRFFINGIVEKKHWKRPIENEFIIQNLSLSLKSCWFMSNGMFILCSLSAIIIAKASFVLWQYPAFVQTSDRRYLVSVYIFNLSKASADHTFDWSSDCQLVSGLSKRESEFAESGRRNANMVSCENKDMWNLLHMYISVADCYTTVEVRSSQVRG